MKFLFFVLSLWIPAVSHAAVYMTVEDSLAKNFPAPIERKEKQLFLSEVQLKRARELAGTDVPIESALITIYEGFEKGKLARVGYLDTHSVRTLNESLMIVMNMDGTIRDIEVLSFNEPPEYRAREGWLKQFENKKVTRQTSKTEFHGITGASITARSVEKAARRIAAIHSAIYGIDAP